MSFKPLYAATALALVLAAPASAAVIVDITEENGSVVFSYKGSLNLIDVSSSYSSSSSNYGNFSAYGYNYDYGNGEYYRDDSVYFYGFDGGYDYHYLNTSDAFAFGDTPASAYAYSYDQGVVSGDSFGIDGYSYDYNYGGGSGYSYGYLTAYTNAGYQSGDAIMGSVTFGNATFQSIGLTDGAIFGFNWANDSVTFRVGSAVEPHVAAVPLPASAPLILAGLGALGVARRLRKKKA